MFIFSFFPPKNVCVCVCVCVYNFYLFGCARPELQHMSCSSSLTPGAWSLSP